MDKPKNIPAFPVIQTDGVSSMGMTLRDYFAAKAMQALITAGWRDASGPIEIACTAYECADYMLAERVK